MSEQHVVKQGEWQGKKLVMLGLARQGKALARFAVAQGARVVVSDLRSAETLTSFMQELTDLPIEFVLGSHPSSLLDGADFVAISGSVPADAPFVNEARSRGIVITNDSQEFIRRSPAPVIGITGSAGKSTTTTLVGEMGKASGRTTWVGGNIGRPLITEVAKMQADDVVVQELSSFQLEIWTQSPAIAAILNVTPNHLDRHKTMDIYTEAKANVLHFQNSNDIAVLPAEGLTHLFSKVTGRLRQFSLTEAVDDGAFVRDGHIILCDSNTETIVCDVSDIRLLGQHNILNVLAAVVLADSADIPPSAMRSAIQQFTGIAHRLELVATINGIRFINDSIATAPERAMAAIRALNEPLILLTGGRDKDLDWDLWADLVHEKVKGVVLFGELGDMVRPKLDPTQTHIVQTTSLESAVELAFNMGQTGDTVLLSPGGTSFDAYVDFAARGVHFRHIVQEMAA